MDDFLLRKFFEKDRWENAIEKAIQKNIDKALLYELCSPEKRIELYHAIASGEYKISPPHEARIPKDDGTFRIVYVNTDSDRIVLSIINDMLFELCPEKIHPSCKSYQKGLGCGKTVKNISHMISKMKTDEIGVKIDLSKYFDSVPIKYIDAEFDYIEEKYGKSSIIDILRTYYHDDTVIDINKNTITKFSSLRQGCAVAAYLADSVLYDIDKAMNDQADTIYVRYSDDILLTGNTWRESFDILKEMLAEKTLTLNPKKIKYLYKNEWFTFLGFSIKNDSISLSKNRIKTFQKEIEKRTLHSETKDIDMITKKVNRYLYHGDGVYSWATSVLPIINVDEDINTLNGFVMDSIRAGATGKKNIGGLGYSHTKNNGVIYRGKGKNVKSNKEKHKTLNNYHSLKCMQNAMLISKSLYHTLTMV